MKIITEKPEPNRWWQGVAFWIALTLLLAAATKCNAATVKLAWNPNPEPEITGYKILIGRSPGVYTQTVPVGSVTTHTLTGLDSASTYYFALKATAGPLESATSAEIAHTTRADIPDMDRSGWIATASSEETTQEDNKAGNAIDGDTKTLWHSKWGITLPPYWITIELPRPALLSGLRYLPRQDGESNGIVTDYEIQTSADGATWSAAGSGKWANDATEKHAVLPLVEVRFVRLWGKDIRMAAAEVTLEGVEVPLPPATLTLTLQQSSDLADWSDLSDSIVPLTSPQKFYRLKIQPTPPP